MKTMIKSILTIASLIVVLGCSKTNQKPEITAADILGNPNYIAMSYGGYRENTRDIQPTVSDIKEDMKILSAMDVKVLRTYNTKLQQVSNLLKAISELKKEDPNFEMYVMVGAWISCEGAFKWTDTITPNHDVEDEQENAAEIERAAALANQYPDIVKMIAVGNEAMVKWATSYYVQPGVILKWVNYLQDLKSQGKLPKDVWITSSDNFASWGGGDEIYHTKDLENLIKAVDFISMHTYPFHDSHYTPAYWKIPDSEQNLSDKEKIDAAMLRARDYAISQYQGVFNYMKSLGLDKPIHIGETGWASISDGLYGPEGEGSRAADEYKQALFYKHMREWTNKAGMSCFYFEAFDEQWKDANNPLGSENHFGLINLKGQAKYALWDLVDKGTFDGLQRGGKTITKTYNGNINELMESVKIPFVKQ
ncbi:hypothetical protein GCM10007962_06280 [Yeosuana aromativorans]|uniref:Endo-1,3-beta-glucanase btgC n=1 Tax=Yeosuana aromativorans TaxID=288019 RepID=A0A8J3FEN0_9FLAO|nr:glycosyl hydrolase family 17 [Yeosuana aromativorans]GGK14773.1 hypothetical protein GCM10007962_06280 [Yeosuana aromativorans]